MVDTDTLVARIKEEFPQFQYKEMRRVETGGKHLVLIFDGLWVFRFERHDTLENAERFRQEIRILDALRKKITITLPQYTYVSKSGLFGGHQLLLGTPLTAQRFSMMSDQRSEEIMRHLAGFLKALHSLPISLFTLSEDDAYRSWPLSRYGARFESERKDAVKGYISSDLTKKISKFFEEHASEQFPEMAIIHADLRDAHILLERGGVIPGVIDFGDCRIGDPAEDIAFFWSYGESFVDQMIEEYGGDKELKRRSRIHFIRYMVDQLYFGVRSHNPTYVSFVGEFLEHYLK